MAMELRNRLEASVGRSLSATLAWNYPTIEMLVDHLAAESSTGRAEDETSASESPKVDDALPAESDGRLQEIDELSEEDALLELRAGRTRGSS